MKQRMISLRLKLVLAIVFLVLVLSTIIVCVSYFTYRNAMNEHYETLGNNVARTARKASCRRRSIRTSSRY